MKVSRSYFQHLEALHAFSECSVQAISSEFPSVVLRLALFSRSYSAYFLRPPDLHPSSDSSADHSPVFQIHTSKCWFKTQYRFPAGSFTSSVTEPVSWPFDSSFTLPYKKKKSMVFTLANDNHLQLFLISLQPHHTFPFLQSVFYIFVKNTSLKK